MSEGKVIDSIVISEPNEDKELKEEDSQGQQVDDSNKDSDQNECPTNLEIDVNGKVNVEQQINDNAAVEEPKNDLVVENIAGDNDDLSSVPRISPKIVSVVGDSAGECRIETGPLLGDSVLDKDEMKKVDDEDDNKDKIEDRTGGVDDAKDLKMKDVDQIRSKRTGNHLERHELCQDNHDESNVIDRETSILQNEGEHIAFRIGEEDVSHNEIQTENSLIRPSELFTADINKQKNISRKKREPCKKIDGEAVERTHVRSSSSGCIYLNQDDTINSNMCWLDEDDEKIDRQESPPHSPMSKEPSLFPAPQMNYASIYSQDTISLSDMSFSEEHSADDGLHLDRNIYPIQYDSLSVLSTNSNELTDIEDNCCHTPPINLDPSGGVELTDVMFLKRKQGSNKCSSCSSPSVFSMDGQPPSPHALAEKLSERLRLLADSWAEINAPNCGYVQSMAVTDTLVWCIDSHDHLFVTSASSASVLWKKVDGKARQIAANQAGSIIWSVNRKKVASYRTNVKSTNPQGM